MNNAQRHPSSFGRGLAQAWIVFEALGADVQESVLRIPALDAVGVPQACA
jgi:hypothetical protein